ncbi:phosphate ABC transporter substrate-binding protein (PhoT family) [Paenibacillus taihuensis]|uniref:Phosphate-binding protein n=1 Tax=Paenibacillus taihuensis TaxID=1156355 RepID=A0A3D9RY37_9BACL|nr:phosphate ABC transporter substrate-binding protein PstS [Paenibacillus taihuensis]REE81575.1 phosphate ABC transporter substrate-binding protein (PhoT family) [Paenibacillus taihuensis]
MSKKWKWFSIGMVAAMTVVVSACGSNQGETSDNSSSSKEITITAAGSTFVNPLFSKMFSEYNKLHPEIKINYQSIGSGGGVKQLTEGTIDFAASDAFMSDEEIGAVKNGVVHIPVTVGAEAIIYNIDGVDKGLKLTQETISDIYLGTIKKWNDPKLKADNPDLNLPDLEITPVYRSDGSGTTAIFTDYLSTVSPEWKEKVGQGKSVQFPVGVGGKGNEGVAGQVKQTPGSIGYAELAYAENNHINYAQLRNKDGKFVYPSLEAATIAADDAAQNMPADTRVSIVEKAGEKAYGIVGISWALLNTNYADATKKQVITDLIKWVYRDGQQYSEPLFYAKIPDGIAKINDDNVAKIK